MFANPAIISDPDLFGIGRQKPRKKSSFINDKFAFLGRNPKPAKANVDRHKTPKSWRANGLITQVQKSISRESDSYDAENALRMH